jgi:molybdenum cofactor guanylyltransferase
MTAASNPTCPKIAGLVLCGGKSTRMGSPKHLLQFGDEIMLQRVCRIVAQVVNPIVVVAAQDQELPPLADDVYVVRDDHDSCGPLAGIAAGLTALAKMDSQPSAAFVTACDTPLMTGDFIKYVIDRLGEFDAVAPTDGEHTHVLSAVYRIELAQQARVLLESGKRRPIALIHNTNSLLIPIEDIRSVDPNLDSMRNTNTTEAFAETLRMAGFSPPG